MKRLLFKLCIAIVLALAFEPSFAQTTKFFKMTKVVLANGTQKAPPVSNGIYLTVTPNGNICYESDKNGGIMVYQNRLNLVSSDATSKLFQGQSYWGQSRFVLANNWSVLNVYDSEGNVYVFKPSSSSQQASTYYAVNNRPQQQNGNTQGTIQSGTIYYPQQNQTTTTTTTTTQKQPRKVQCRNCKGTGIAWVETKYPPRYSANYETVVIHCPDCNSTVDHYHVKHRCKVCDHGYVLEY